MAYTYALPYEFYEQDKVRRYGFHGTSHKYVSQRAAAMLGKPAEELKLISPATWATVPPSPPSTAARAWIPPWASPLAGLPMGTRCGDIDAGILEYLMNKHGYDIKEMLNILNKKSGVLGISGVSSDFRDLEDAPQGQPAGSAGAGLLRVRRHQAHRLLRRRHGRSGRHHLHRRRG